MSVPFDLTWRPAQWNLAAPLYWPKPARVNVGDLFRPGTQDEWIAAVFGVMAAASRHTFAITTEHPERLREWFRWLSETIAAERVGTPLYVLTRFVERIAGERLHPILDAMYDSAAAINAIAERPLPSVHLGVRVTDQRTANERIPHLLSTPAAVRFVEVVPAGPVDLESFLYLPTRCLDCGSRSSVYDTNPNDLPTPGTCLLGVPMTGEPGALRCGACQSLNVDEQRPLDWVVVSGDSGPDAQPCDVEWTRSIVTQCREAGVPVFVRGDDLPEDLRVRELPEVANVRP